MRSFKMLFCIPQQREKTVVRKTRIIRRTPFREIVLFVEVEEEVMETRICGISNMIPPDMSSTVTAEEVAEVSEEEIVAMAAVDGAEVAHPHDFVVDKTPTTFKESTCRGQTFKFLEKMGDTGGVKIFPIGLDSEKSKANDTMTS